MEGSEIKDFYDLLTQREEIDVIYDKYAGAEGQMTARDVLNFLLNEQREQASMEDAVKLIEKYEVDEAGRLRSDMEYLVFWGYPAHDTWFANILIPSNCPLSSSEAEEVHDQRRLPDVPAPRRGHHLQPGS